jgi:peroxiredoxin
MLAQLATAHPSIVDNGGAVIGVAPAAGFQAKHLMETSIPYELLMDREHSLSRKLEVGTQSLFRFVFNLKAWWNYAMAFLSNRKQGRITQSYAVLPAIFVIDADSNVVYLHRGTGIADYPPLAEVLAELATLLSADS